MPAMVGRSGLPVALGQVRQDDVVEALIGDEGGRCTCLRRRGLRWARRLCSPRCLGWFGRRHHRARGFGSAHGTGDGRVAALFDHVRAARYRPSAHRCRRSLSGRGCRWGPGTDHDLSLHDDGCDPGRRASRYGRLRRHASGGGGGLGGEPVAARPAKCVGARPRDRGLGQVHGQRLGRRPWFVSRGWKSIEVQLGGWCRRPGLDLDGRRLRRCLRRGFWRRLGRGFRGGLE